MKKHFTAEELSMRRQEMARRRRNLSEKRNEEVKVCWTTTWPCKTRNWFTYADGILDGNYQQTSQEASAKD